MKINWKDIQEAAAQIDKIPQTMTARISGEGWILYRIRGKKPIIRIDIKEEVKK